MAQVNKISIQDAILNAIDTIKSKRARPDQNRITELVIKTLDPTNSSPGTNNSDLKKRILAELEVAVTDGIVIRVRYKDGISYRNPGTTSRAQGKIYPDGKDTDPEDQQEQQPQDATEKWSADKSQVTSGHGTGTDVVIKVNSTPDTKLGPQEGVSTKQESKSESKTRNGHAKLVTSSPAPPELKVFSASQPAIEEPTPALKPPILKLGPTVLKIAAASSSQQSSSSGRSQTTAATGKSQPSGPNSVQSTPDKNVTAPDDGSANRRGARKRTKKSLGSDFLDPSELGYGFLKSSFDPKCTVCSQVGPRKDDLINCSKCSFSAHAKCLTLWESVSVRKGDKKWLCNECRPKCTTCNLSQSDHKNPLMTCAECDSCYHINCLDFGMDTDASNWKCLDCIDLSDDRVSTSGQLGHRKPSPATLTTIEIRGNGYGNGSFTTTKTVVVKEQSKKTYSRPESSGVSLLMNTLVKSKVDASLCSVVPIKKLELVIEKPQIINFESGSVVKDTKAPTPPPAPQELVVNEAPAEEDMQIEEEMPMESAMDVTNLHIESDSMTVVKSDGKENSDSAQVQQPSAAPVSFKRKLPSDWSVSDVAEFLDSVGFATESSLFRDQEIDGKSLLLLKRDDVISGLNLKLGPALKIYSLINHLQYR